MNTNDPRFRLSDQRAAIATLTPLERIAAERIRERLRRHGTAMRPIELSGASGVDLMTLQRDFRFLDALRAFGVRVERDRTIVRSFGLYEWRGR